MRLSLKKIIVKLEYLIETIIKRSSRLCSGEMLRDGPGEMQSSVAIPPKLRCCHTSFGGQEIFVLDRMATMLHWIPAATFWLDVWIQEPYPHMPMKGVLHVMFITAFLVNDGITTALLEHYKTKISYGYGQL